MVDSCSNHSWHHPGDTYRSSVLHFSCCHAFMPHHDDWNRKEGKFTEGCTCSRCGAKRGGGGKTSGGFIGGAVNLAKAWNNNLNNFSQGWQ